MTKNGLRFPMMSSVSALIKVIQFKLIYNSRLLNHRYYFIMAQPLDF